jgi:TPR repeat protein
LKRVVAVGILMGIVSALYAETFEENVRGCDDGNAKACYDAGNTYSAEAYKEKDYQSAVAASKVASFYKKSCNLGYAEGCTAYGMSYAADKNKDPQENAGYYFQQGCDGGDVTGCNLLNFSPFNQ